MDDTIAIIVPCYNEFKRFPKDDFIAFLSRTKQCKIIFSDDGSKDKTVSILEEIREQAPESVFINSMVQNSGKAEAVRSGILFCYEKNIQFTKIAFLDSDLAVSLDECLEISTHVKHDVAFAFASRIQKIDNHIDRRPYRHFIGRIIAGIISKILRLNVYDTQCGCKVFTHDLAKIIFQDEFISKWLFDVELFFRIKHFYHTDNLKEIAREVPVKSWIDSAGSKVKFSYFFKLWHDLYMINKKYNG